MYKKLSENLKKLIKNDTSVEEVELITGMINDVNTLESKHNDTIKTAEDYRNKYVNSVLKMGNGTPTTEIPKEKKRKTLEEIATEIVNKDKDKK